MHPQTGMNSTTHIISLGAAQSGGFRARLLRHQHWYGSILPPNAKSHLMVRRPSLFDMGHSGATNWRQPCLSHPFSDRTFPLCWRHNSLNSDPVRRPHNRNYESAVANVFVWRSCSHPMKFNAINALYRECFKFGAAVPRVISVGTPKGRLTDVLRRYRA